MLGFNKCFYQDGSTPRLTYYIFLRQYTVRQMTKYNILSIIIFVIVVQSCRNESKVVYADISDVGRLGRRCSNSTLPTGINYSANETTPTSTRALGLLSWHGAVSRSACSTSSGARRLRRV